MQLSKQTVLFYNARLALREGKAPEALKLWLLRNVVANDENHVGRYDGDYRSVAWAALGAQGLCGDGFPDGEGAGLWPLAVHNQVVATLTKGMVPNVQNPNDARSTWGGSSARSRCTTCSTRPSCAR
ncbi:MAG: hypothetical protein IPJ65_43315 [Archangiaceae bacterium]|nr:hypothetical protein [Archangiaceae bacterium]